MSDKPLDCVGITGEVGKHDFKLSPEERVKQLLAGARKTVAPLVAAERKGENIDAELMGFRMKAT